MKFIELQRLFKERGFFNIDEIKFIEPDFYRARLNEWQKKGYIGKIIRRFYYFKDIDINEIFLFVIANKIYSPSYISLECALSYYGIIPEKTFLITSITTKKTYNFKTSIGNFSYRKIKKELFFGYELKKINNQSFLIATPEKALADYFYLNPKNSSKEHIYEMRINKSILNTLLSKKRIDEILDRFNDKNVKNAFNCIRGL
jgi:predicted transcriptional regulator of viral defense system